MPFSDAHKFLKCIRGRSDLTMLLMQTGPQSTETAVEAKEQNPGGKLLWFSDLDFSLLAYRLRASYFGLLPANEETLKQALTEARLMPVTRL